MRLLVIIMILWFAVTKELKDFVQISNTVDCLSWYQNYYNSKVCKPSPSYSTLNWWDYLDNSFDWGGGTSGVCSDDSFNFPEDSSMLLCPTEWSCNGQYTYLYNEYETTINSNYVQLGGVWWYSLSKQSSNYDGIRVYNLYSRNVTVSIYSKNGDNSYNIEQRLFSSGDDIKIPVNGFRSIYVLAISDSTRIGKFQFSASLYKDPLSTGAIVGIVLGCVAFCVIFIIFLVCCVKWCKKIIRKRKEAKMRQRNYQNVMPNANIPVGSNQYNYNNYPANPVGTLNWRKINLLRSH